MTKTTTALHLHADSSVVDPNDGSVSLNLRAMARGQRTFEDIIDGGGGTAAIRSVIVSTSRQNERLSRDSSADAALDFDVGLAPRTSGSVSLGPSEATTPSALAFGTHKLAGIPTHILDSGVLTYELSSNHSSGGLAPRLVAGDALVVVYGTQSSTSSATVVIATAEASKTEATLATAIETALNASNVEGTWNASFDQETRCLKVTNTTTSFTLHTGAAGRTQAQRRRLASLLGLADHDTAAVADDDDNTDAAAQRGNGKTHALTNTLHGYRPLRKDSDTTELLRYEYVDDDDSTKKSRRSFVYGLSLRAGLPYAAAYRSVFADSGGGVPEASRRGLRQLLVCKNNSVPTALAGGGAAEVKTSAEARHFVVFGRVVRIPTDIDGHQGELALLFFSRYEDAAVDYGNARSLAVSPSGRRVLDIGPSLGNYTVAARATADTHTLRVLNRSVLDLPKTFVDGLLPSTAAPTAVAEVLYRGDGESSNTLGLVAVQATGRRLVYDVSGVAHEDSTVVVHRTPLPPETVLYMRRLKELEDTNSAAARIVLFADKELAAKDFTLPPGVTDGSALTTARLKCYAAATAALPLVRSSQTDTAAGGSKQAAYDSDTHHFTSALAVRLDTSTTNTAGIDYSTNELVLANGRDTRLSVGDRVVLQAPTANESGRPYVFPELTTPRTPHFFEAAAPPAVVVPVEGGICTVTSLAGRRFGLLDAHGRRVQLGAWRDSVAALSVACAGADQGRVRLVRARAALPWETMYIELTGFAGSDATGVSSTDPHVDRKLAAVVPRGLVNRYVPCEMCVPIRGSLRDARMRVAVATAAGGATRPAAFPADAERIDVVVQIETSDIGQREQQARFAQLMQALLAAAPPSGDPPPRMPFQTWKNER